MDVNMLKCKKCGGWYNGFLNAECPYCNGTKAPMMESTDDSKDNIEKTSCIEHGDENDHGKGGVHTASVRTEFDPVVGWLVAIGGPNKGRDYKIHAEHNYIGRLSGDIIIQGDETISRENHAFVTYDTRDRIYYITPGEGRSIVRYNGKALLQATELKAYDQIEIGNTVLVFMPLCGGSFDWFAEEEN